MIKVENIKVFNIEGAVRGMRNPKNSWHLSDSKTVITDSFDKEFVVGPKDLQLMKTLYEAGPEHAKYLRQIFISMDITGPRFWWTEYDTYKINTCSNSCSTMHRLTSKPIEVSDFSFIPGQSVGELDDWKDITEDEWQTIWKMADAFSKYIDCVEKLRKVVDEKPNKIFFKLLISMLPQGYNQKRTITFTYATALNMIHQRENHKLSEWKDFVRILKGLPYIKELIE